MRRAALSFLIIFGLLLSAWQVAGQGMLTLGAGSAGGGSAFDPATTAWVNAVVAAGGTVSGTQKGFVDTLILCEKTAANGNLFALLDRLWIHASENVTQATVDTIADASLTNHGLSFTVSQGFTGDGATTYADSGYSSGPNFT